MHTEFYKRLLIVVNTYTVVLFIIIRVFILTIINIEYTLTTLY